MNNGNIMTFLDENNNKIDYSILEQKLLCGTEYVALAPVNSPNHIEIFKIKFDKDWNESLEQVSSEKELSMYKQISKLKF